MVGLMQAVSIRKRRFGLMAISDKLPAFSKKRDQLMGCADG
jgi:hypothetical protein